MAKIELRVSDALKDAIKTISTKDANGNVSAYIKKLILEDLRNKMSSKDYIDMIESDLT